MSIPLEDDQGTPPVSGYNIPPYPQSHPYSPWTSSKLPEYQNRWPLHFISSSKLCKLIFQSQNQLYNHKCLFIHLSFSKTPQQLEIIILHHVSFIFLWKLKISILNISIMNDQLFDWGLSGRILIIQPISVLKRFSLSVVRFLGKQSWKLLWNSTDFNCTSKLHINDVIQSWS